MAEDISIPVSADKQAKYESLLPQISALIGLETDLVANLANMSAALQMAFSFLWVGFYLKKENELVLGPFQGPVACTRIAFGKGVCGASYAQKETIVVPDVEAFPGHIACSSASRSEIVVPVIKNGEVAMVLDIDSVELNTFDEVDKKYLEQLAEAIAEKL
ncbi:GAF domain-containing protein [Flammeovirgaceae bacterium SG7u.111]|nr:GAF domain-containing protein [Flammeovirgaceae bacterium SG7u.132]WPO35461.1 GAF domain-containing protein [Flammeovirgaceae bacterium SG7u.111]